jgi:hypothetical protein
VESHLSDPDLNLSLTHIFNKADENLHGTVDYQSLNVKKFDGLSYIEEKCEEIHINNNFVRPLLFFKNLLGQLNRNLLDQVFFFNESEANQQMIHTISG